MFRFGLQGEGLRGELEIILRKYWSILISQAATIALAGMLYLMTLTLTQVTYAASSQQQYVLNVDGRTFEVAYSIEGGQLGNITLDEKSKALQISLNANIDGYLNIKLPRELIDSVKDGRDTDFAVALYGKDGNANSTSVTEFFSPVDSRVLHIAFGSGTSRIVISGTSVVPEFGSLAGIVLATVLTGYYAMIRLSSKEAKR